jgi:hypothetical protein
MLYAAGCDAAIKVFTYGRFLSERGNLSAVKRTH